MRKIIKIARLELSILFYSPIAWIILVILFLQGGLAYFDMLYSQETQQQLDRDLSVLTRVMFAGEKGMFSTLIEYLYLYIPLLTMGIFSREYVSGSIKLLQSSPVTATQIVLGKYLSIVIYAFIAVGMLGLYAVSAYFSIEHMDVKFVLFGLLALFLLICTYSAIGLFMSSLTSYQIVAAISTLALLAFLNYAQILGAKYDGFREITHWLSIGGRAEEIVNGLLTTREIAYFLLIILFFLMVTILRIVQERAGTKPIIKALQYLALAVVLLGIGYITSLIRFTGYYDTTQIKDRTISAYGQSIASRIDGPIKLVTYINVLDRRAEYASPKNRINDLANFESINRFIPQLEMDYVAYYDSIPYLKLDSNETFLSKSEKAADALGINFKKLLTPEDMKKFPEVALENNTLVRFFEYKGKRVPLRMFDDMFVYPKEGEINASLVRLLDGPAVLGLLSGKGERGIDNYGNGEYSILLNGQTVRGSLINRGFEIQKLKASSLDDFKGVGIVIADPREPYTTEELNSIFRYIERGGNIYLLADPQGSKEYLQPVAEKLGLKFMDGTLMQDSEDYDVDLLRLYLTPEAEENGFLYYEGAKLVMNKAMGIEPLNDNKGFSRVVLMRSDDKDTWNKLGTYDLNLKKEVFTEGKDVRVSVPTAMKLLRKVNGKDQHVFVFGDADFISNAELNRFNINSINSLVAGRIFNTIRDRKALVGAEKDKAPDVIIKSSRKSINTQKLIYLLIIPVLIAVTAVVVLKRRKRK